MSTNNEMNTTTDRDGADNIVFEYKCLAAWGYEGMDSGYDVTLRENGELTVSKYRMGLQAPEMTRTITQDKTLADDVKAVIDEMRDELLTFPSTIDNQSCDGSEELFRFGEKCISGYNLMMESLEEIKEANPDGYEYYKDIAIMENRLLSLYDRVAEIINRHDTGISMRLARETQGAGLSGGYRELFADL